MEGQGPTPSHTHWCSLPSLRPVTVTLNRMLIKPALAWNLYGKVGLGTYMCTDDPSVPALCQATGGWLGSHWHYYMKGSELGLHSTGVCLSFCLTAFYYYCVIFISYFITLEITCQNTNDLSVHFIFSFLGKDTVLMHKMAFHVHCLVFWIKTVVEWIRLLNQF